jgi:hypothetical protein
MKKLFISLILIAGMAMVSKGQKHSYGLSVGVGNGTILKQRSIGGPSYDVGTAFSIGLQYSKKINDNLHLMTGVNWYTNTLTVIPSFYPGIDQTPKDYNVQLIYIPVLLKVNLGKYFFINGGLLGDIDISKGKYIASQSGIGASIGPGVEFSLGGKFAIQLNPFLNFHGLILTNKESYPERIFDPGVKLNFVLKR